MAVLQRSKTVIAGLTTDLENIQTSVGLASDLTFAADGTTNYLQSATSVKNAANLLDGEIKSINDDLGSATLTTSASTVHGAVNELDGELGTITAAAMGTTASTVSGAISELELRIESDEGDLTNLIDGSSQTVADLEGRLDTIEGADTVEGSIAKALKDAKDYTDTLEGDATQTVGQIEDRVDTLEGDSTVVGSVDYKIAQVIDSAPEALNTLKEIADYINVDPDTDVLSAITNAVTDAKDELKGAVSESFDTLEEIETALDIINGADTVAGSIAKAQADAESYADNAVSTLEGDATKTVGALEDELDILNGADTVEGSVAKAQADAEAYADAHFLNIDDIATARTDIDVYSTSEVDSAIAGGGAVFITEVLTVTADAITLSHDAKNNVIFNFGTVRHIDANGVAYDIPVTGSGSAWTLSPDESGQFDTKTVKIQYAYTPSV